MAGLGGVLLLRGRATGVGACSAGDWGQASAAAGSGGRRAHC